MHKGSSGSLLAMLLVNWDKMYHVDPWAMALMQHCVIKTEAAQVAGSYGQGYQPLWALLVHKARRLGFVKGGTISLYICLQMSRVICKGETWHVPIRPQRTWGAVH